MELSLLKIEGQVLKLVALADDLEEEVGTELVDGQVADFIQDEELWGEVFFELAPQGAGLLGGGKVVDDVDGVGEENGVAVQAGGIAQGGGEVGLADADGAQKDDVGLVTEELEAEEVLDLEAVDFFGPVPAELFEGFQDGEAGLLDAALDEALEALVVFALDQALEVLKVVVVLFGGQAGGLLVVLLDVGQLEVIELAGQKGWRHGVFGWWLDGRSSGRPVLEGQVLLAITVR